jgi:hypothetical protein
MSHLNLASSRGFMPSLLNSFTMILVTEIGDRTFWVAAIMAMNNDRCARRRPLAPFPAPATPSPPPPPPLSSPVSPCSSAQPVRSW